MDNDERHRKVAEAAYYRAQQRGFSGSSELEDWLEAEREFDALLTPFSDAMPSEGADTEAEKNKDREEPVVPPSS